MTEAEKEALRAVLGDALAYADLRKNWHSFCDADWFSGSYTFPERMEAAGLIQWRSVNGEDLEQPFAAERGIEAGGHIWVLTEKGRLVLNWEPPHD